MAKQIFAAEISHEHAPLHIREKLASSEEGVKAYIQQLGKDLDEVFVLSTCNRFAIYGAGESINPLLNFFFGDPELFNYVQFYKSTEASVQHLFATASGLRSQVKGEHQILAQIKQAHKLALSCSSIGLKMDNLLREAIRVGKKVRTETGIDKFCSSVVDAGFSLVEKKLSDLSNRNILIIGTGKIARLALSYLQQEQASNVTIVSHDLDRAVELANHYQAKAGHIENVSHYFMLSDVIIGGTHHEVSLCPKTMHETCMRHTAIFDTTRKHIILDFGMPRNFNDSIRKYPTIELYNLDDLKALHATPLDAFGNLDDAKRIADAEATEFINILQQLELTPILSAYWTRLVNLKDEQLNWLLPKLENVNEHDIDLIKKYAHKLIRSISREPLKNLRALAGDTQANVTVEVVKNLYDFHHVKLNLSIN